MFTQLLLGSIGISRGAGRCVHRINSRASEKRCKNPFAVIFDTVVSNDRRAATLAGNADKRRTVRRNVFGFAAIGFL
jgi:hypothetical protein